MKIAILNYNMGNLASVANALNALNFRAEIINCPHKIAHCDKLILPGVGAFGDAMAHLNQSGMGEAIKTFAKSGKYMLGICLGMQLLMDKSYEFGEFSGLGLIKGEVVKFDFGESCENYGDSRENYGESCESYGDSARDSQKHSHDGNLSCNDSRLKIPHIGWNRIEIVRESPLLQDIENGAYLYFVHSFFVRPREKSDIIATCDYGKSFSAIIQKNNIFGIQPHPEKSANLGLKILENFINLK